MAVSWGPVACDGGDSGGGDITPLGMGANPETSERRGEEGEENPPTPIVPMKKPVEMESFSTCDQLLDRLQGDAIKQLNRPIDQISENIAGSSFTPWGGSPGFGGRGGSNSGDDVVGRFVETNLTAKGADEADIAKADGSELFVISNGKVHSFTLSAEEKLELNSSLTVSGKARELLAEGGQVMVFRQRVDDLPAMKVPL